MRLLRTLFLAVILAGAFFYFTTYRSDFHPSRWMGRPDKVELTEAAGNESLDSEEQNNIRDRKSVV